MNHKINVITYHRLHCIDRSEEQKATSPHMNIVLGSEDDNYVCVIETVSMVSCEQLVYIYDIHIS